MRPEYGWCYAPLDGALCLRAKDHTGCHREFVFIDGGRRRWDVVEDDEASDVEGGSVGGSANTGGHAQ